MNPAELFRHETEALQLAPGDSLFREGDKRREDIRVVGRGNGNLAWRFRARDRGTGSVDW
jgi:hypothetical protein